MFMSALASALVVGVGVGVLSRGTVVNRTKHC